MKKSDVTYTTIILGLLVILALLWRYDRQQKREDVLTAPVLKENEKTKIIVDTNRKRVQVVTRPIGNDKGIKDAGTQVVKVTEGARKVVITEHTDGTIQVVAGNKGLTFEPGLALYCSDKLRIGVDVQVTYWKQWGLLVGAGIAIGDEPRTMRAHVAINRSLPLKYMGNTTVFVGMDHKKDLVAGLRVRF